jgi:hypothetical protein
MSSKEGKTMALFRKKEPPKEQPAEPIVREVFETVYANLTEKMLRVELVDTHGYTKSVVVEENGGMIRLDSNGILIALIGKRGKAYTDLQPYINKMAESMAIDVKSGDYGEYYHVKLRFSKGMVVEQ